MGTVGRLAVVACIAVNAFACTNRGSFEPQIYGDVQIVPATLPADGVTQAAVSVVVRSSGVKLPAGWGIALNSSQAGATILQPGPPDANGQCTGYVQTRVPGTQTIRPTLVLEGQQFALPTAALVTFNTLLPGGPGVPSDLTSTLVANPNVVSPDGSSVAVVTLHVADSTGAPVAGAAVTFASTGTHNFFSSSEGLTAPDGSLVVTLASTVAETKTVSAHAGSMAVATQVVFSEAVPSSLLSTLVANPNPVVADGVSQSTLTLTLRNSAGSPIANQGVTWTASGSNNTFTPVSGSTNASGVFTATLASTTVEAKTVTATIGSITKTTVVAFVAGPAAMFTVTGLPATTIQGQPRTITVTAYDAQGHVATGYVGTVTFNSTDPDATLPANTPFTAGMAGVQTFANMLTLSATGTQTVTVQDTLQNSVTGSASTTVLSCTVSSRANVLSTCAVVSGALKCWGVNGDGQLGYGDTTGRGGSANQMGTNLPAISLGTGRTAVAVAVGGGANGDGHTCAVLDNSQLECWGLNSNGQLGYGDTLQRTSPAGAAIDLGTGRTALAVTAGGYYSCAVLDDHTIKCWGRNNTG